MKIAQSWGPVLSRDSRQVTMQTVFSSVEQEDLSALPRLHTFRTIPGKQCLSKCFVKQRVANFFCKGPLVSVATTQFCCCSVEAATNNTRTNEHGCVPIKLYLWTLKSELHVIFTCHKILFYWFFPNHLKSFLAHGPYKSRCWAGFGPGAVVCQLLL